MVFQTLSIFVMFDTQNGFADHYDNIVISNLEPSRVMPISNL
jgi:hypothetical protein